MRARRQGLNVFGWLLKYLISSSKVPVNEVFAALISETLQQKSPLALLMVLEAWAAHTRLSSPSLSLYTTIFWYFLTLNRFIIILE